MHCTVPTIVIVRTPGGGPGTAGPPRCRRAAPAGSAATARGFGRASPARQPRIEQTGRHEAQGIDEQQGCRADDRQARPDRRRDDDLDRRSPHPKTAVLATAIRSRPTSTGSAPKFAPSKNVASGRYDERHHHHVRHGQDTEQVRQRDRGHHELPPSMSAQTITRCGPNGRREPRRAGRRRVRRRLQRRHQRRQERRAAEPVDQHRERDERDRRPGRRQQARPRSTAGSRRRHAGETGPPAGRSGPPSRRWRRCRRVSFRMTAPRAPGPPGRPDPSPTAWIRSPPRSRARRRVRPRPVELPRRREARGSRT